MSLIDRRFLQANLPNAEITRFQNAVRVRGIGDKVHDCHEYATFDLYLPGDSKVARISRGARVVDDLKAKMLIGMDIIGPEGISVHIPSRTATVESCGSMQVPLGVQPTTERVDRVVRLTKLITIPARSTALIPLKLRGPTALPRGRDYLFEPSKANLGEEGGYVAHIIDSDTQYIQARNATDSPVIVPRHARLGKVMDYDAEGCYVASAELSLPRCRTCFLGEEGSCAGWTSYGSVREGNGNSSSDCPSKLQHYRPHRATCPGRHSRICRSQRPYRVRKTRSPRSTPRSGGHLP